MDQNELLNLAKSVKNSIDSTLNSVLTPDVLNGMTTDQIQMINKSREALNMRMSIDDITDLMKTTNNMKNGN